MKKVLTLCFNLGIIPFVETTLAHRQAVRQRTLTPSSKVRILVGQLTDLEELVLRGLSFYMRKWYTKEVFIVPQKLR